MKRIIPIVVLVAGWALAQMPPPQYQPVSPNYSPNSPGNPFYITGTVVVDGGGGGGGGGGVPDGGWVNVGNFGQAPGASWAIPAYVLTDGGFFDGGWVNVGNIVSVIGNFLGDGGWVNIGNTVNVQGFVQAVIDGGVVVSLWDGGVIVLNTVTVTGTVSATQGTSPWVVSQSSTPWGVNFWDGGVILENPADINGSSWANPSYVITDAGLGDGGWVNVGNASQLPGASWLSPSYVILDAGSSGGGPATQSGNWYVQAVIDGGVYVTQGTSPWVVSGYVQAVIDGGVNVTVANPLLQGVVDGGWVNIGNQLIQPVTDGGWVNVGNSPTVLSGAYSNFLAQIQPAQTLDAGLASQVGYQIAGYTVASGSTPTSVPAGKVLMPALDQQSHLRANIGPENPEHYYQSGSSETLVVPYQVTTKYYMTDVVLSCGTTAQEMKLLSCDAGSTTTYEDFYCPANGGLSVHQITPQAVPVGQNACCYPVGGTTGTCTVDGFNAP